MAAAAKLRFVIPARSAREFHAYIAGYSAAIDQLPAPAEDEGHRIAKEFDAWVRANRPGREGWVETAAVSGADGDGVAAAASLFEDFLASRDQQLPNINLEEWMGRGYQPPDPELLEYPRVSSAAPRMGRKT